MQILLAVRHDLCFPMPFHSAKSAKSVQTTTPSPTMPCHFFYTLALLAQVTAPLAAEAGPTRRLLDVPKWSFLTFYFYFIIISYFILLLFHILLLHIYIYIHLFTFTLHYIQNRVHTKIRESILFTGPPLDGNPCGILPHFTS